MPLSPRQILLAALAVLLLSACSEVRETEPGRTANEQLLISTAADHAAKRLDFGFPAGAAVFLDAAYFESYDKPYVLGLLRTEVARQEGALVGHRGQADYVVEVRSGALSVNRSKDYFGIGGFDVPVPLSETYSMPLASIYEDHDRTGIAKLAATTYEADSGKLVRVSGPVYGLSWMDRDAILGIGWRDSNILPKHVEKDSRPRSMESR